MKTINGGKFIVFEGGEGSGKSTMMDAMYMRLLEDGWDTRMTREPGGVKEAELIRDVVVNNFNELGPIPQLFLYSASRYLNVKKVIKPSLENGKIVLCDRFALTTIIYQGILGDIPMGDVVGITKMATMGIRPDLEIILDVDPAVGLKRAHDRAETNEIDDLDISWHTKVNNEYRYNSYGKKRVIIDANQDIARAMEQVYKAICTILPEK